MNKELDLWQFIAERLGRNESVMLLVVAESSGSSPGRQGYKMVVAADGELCGSIGGGVMEVSLVELAKGKSKKAKGKTEVTVIDQIHRKDVPNSSGMICSGKQTVTFKLLTPESLETVQIFADALRTRVPSMLTITPRGLNIESSKAGIPNFHFERLTETDFVYRE